jgi:hypothetical protein
MPLEAIVPLGYEGRPANGQPLAKPPVRGELLVRRQARGRFHSGWPSSHQRARC